MKQLSHKQIASKGGKATLAKHGVDHFKNAGKAGAETKLKKFGVDYFTRLSKAGVAARKANAERKLLLENTK